MSNLDSASHDLEEHPVIAGWRDHLLFLLFVAFWLWPIVWVGLTHRDATGMGNVLNNNYRIACLFTHRVKNWTEYYFQLKLVDGEVWLNTEESDYSRMEPFGHRT